MKNKFISAPFDPCNKPLIFFLSTFYENARVERRKVQNTESKKSLARAIGGGEKTLVYILNAYNHV